MDDRSMNRRREWRSPRIFSKVPPVVYVVLGVVAAFVAIADLASPDRRVVLVDTRAIRASKPPFDYQNDQRRFMGLVFEPVCPADSETSETTPMAVGHECKVTEDGVQVKLRDGLLAGKDGTPVNAADLEEGLKDQESPLLKGYAPKAQGNVLSLIWEKEGEPPLGHYSLLSSLRVQAATVVVDGKTVGTGPFYVDKLWCKEKVESEAERVEGETVEGEEGEGETVEGEAVESEEGEDEKSESEEGEKKKRECSPPGGSPPIGFGALDEWLEDVLVLRRRDRSRSATTEIVVVGLGGEKDATARATALAQALEDADVHGLFDVEADLEDELRKASRGHTGWRFSEPLEDRVLVAALRPPGLPKEDTYLPPECRSRLRPALAQIRRDPSFLQAIHARPAYQLLPEPFETVHVWQGPSKVPGPESSESSKDCERKIGLVTHAAWKNAAMEIVWRLPKGLKVEVEALRPDEEGQRRADREYGISFLSLVSDRRSEAHYLWDNLNSSHWGAQTDVEKALKLAREEAEGKEIYEGIDGLHQELDAYLIPMGAPTRVVAMSDRLLGLDPSAWSLDPDYLRLEPSDSRFRFRFLLLSFSVVLFAVAITSHLARKGSERRRRVELSLRMLRHDMLAPLSTIRAYAERVQAREPRIGEALMSEAEAALTAAEDARFVLQEGRLQATGSASTRLREIVVPILDSLRRRSSYEAGQEPKIMLDLPDEAVAVPPEVARFVVRTLVENAWRHRGDRPLVLELTGTASGRVFHAAVKDHGPGMSAAEAEQLFRPGYRTEAARRDFVHGSGLGLHLARSFLRLHGGEIELRRAADPTTFTIRFPLAPTDHGKLSESPGKETP